MVDFVPDPGAPLVTRRALIRQSIGDLFVGREHDLAALMRVIDSPASCGFINLHGISGIGKTMLLARLIASAEERGSLTCLIDLAFCRSAISLLSKLSLGLTTPFLADMANACLQVRNRYEKLHEGLFGGGTFPPSALAQISRLSEFDGEPTETTVHQRTPFDVDSLFEAQRQLGTDYSFFRDPTFEYARALVLDINALALTRPARSCILIVLDRAEAVPETLLNWIRDHVFRDLAENVGLLIAGQKPLVDGWDDLLRLGRSIELKQMSEPEIADLARKFGIGDESAIGWIYSASAGVPLFAEELCRNYARDPRIAEKDPKYVSPPEAIVGRYLAAVAPEHRELVERASLLRYVSHENAAATLGQAESVQLLSIIGTLPYVVEGAKGFVIHDRVRNYLDRHFRKHNPARYVTICLAAATYYGDCAARGVEVFESLTEELYHRVRANSNAGLECLRARFSEFSLLNQPQECETLVKTAILADLDAPVWIGLFQSIILYQRQEFRESLEVLQGIRDRAVLGMDDELRQQVLFYCAVSCWYLCDFPEAMSYAERAVDAFPTTTPAAPSMAQRRTFHHNRALGIIALTQDRLGRFQEGIETALKMAQAARESLDRTSLGYALNSAGYFSWHEGHWRNADTYLSESITTWSLLYSDFGSCYPLGHRAAMRTLIGDPAYGVQSLSRCLERAQRYSNREMECKTGHALAEALWGEGCAAESVDAASASIDIARTIGQRYFAADALRVKAMSHLLDGDEEEARTALAESLSLSLAISAPYIERRAQAVAYASGLSRLLKLPDIEFDRWIDTTLSASFGRAILDFGRVAIRAGRIDQLMQSRPNFLDRLFGSVLALNFNAFLLLQREAAERGILVPSLGKIALAAVTRNARSVDQIAEEAASRDFIVSSTGRGIRERFNSVLWDKALAKLDCPPHVSG